MKSFLRIFVQGLIVFIPIVITGAVLFRLFRYFEGMFSVVGFTGSTTLNGLYGFLLTVLFIFLLGIIAPSYFFRQIFTFLENKLEHAPFIRHIYSPVRDFTNAFVGNKKKFNKPVMVLTNPAAGIYEMGFVTREDLSEFRIDEMIAVYLPMSFSLSGRLLIVPTSQVKPLDADAGETMKFVVSGGVVEET